MPERSVEPTNLELDQFIWEGLAETETIEGQVLFPLTTALQVSRAWRNTYGDEETFWSSTRLFDTPWAPGELVTAKVDNDQRREYKEVLGVDALYAKRHGYEDFDSLIGAVQIEGYSSEVGEIFQKFYEVTRQAISVLDGSGPRNEWEDFCFDFLPHGSEAVLDGTDDDLVRMIFVGLDRNVRVDAQSYLTRMCGSLCFKDLATGFGSKEEEEKAVRQVEAIEELAKECELDTSKVLSGGFAVIQMG